MAATLNDYAVLSATVYNKVRGDKNQLPVPANWTEVDNDLNHPITGFAASAYRNGNDVVIAFRGTENLMDGVADLLLGVGLGSAQLTQAALFYQVVKAANPGANISFAGHSLGGGLASVMSVWFDRPAVVFNEAPFEATALNPLLVKATAFALNEAGPGDPALDRLADANRFADLSALYTLRETQVTNYYMPGEFLVPLRGLLPTVAGTNNPVTTLGTGATGTFDLHSINLLAARLLEPKLGTLGYRLPTLVKQLFSTEARAADLNSQSRDFLTNILADQISKGYDSQDGLLAKFAADIDTLTNGLPLSGDKAIDLAVRLGIEHYYHMLDNGVGEPLFGQVGSGIQADLNKFVVGLDQIKPYGELRQFALDAADDADARDAITEFITDKRRWNIAVGNGGLSGSADGDVSDIVLGGKGADDFDAGAGDDLLIGGAGTDDLQGDAGSDKLYGGSGNDRLDGGEGDDILVGNAGTDLLKGGTGFDEYRYSSRAGFDVIDDAREGQNHDGAQSGKVLYDKTTLSGGGKQGNWLWSSDDGFTYRTDGDPDKDEVTLTVTGGKGGLLTIDHFKNDDLGIHLGDQPPGAGGGRRSPRGVAPQAPDAPPDSGNTANRRDPLLVDLGAGIQTVGLEANLHFDGDANGLKERTGWAAVGTGLLMLDRDNDGQLTDGSELFGDATPVNGGIAVNGFLALAQYDRNRDGRIDAADPVWNQLKVWTHATDPITGNPILNDPDYGGELRTLDELGIRTIHLNAATDQVTDAQGNTRLRSASLELADGSTREIAEYRLARNGADTVAIERLALDADLRLMPELPGMGSVNDLRQVMQRDTRGTLKNLVAAFAGEADPQGTNNEWRIAA